MKNKLLQAGIVAAGLFFSVKTSAQAPTAAFSISQSSVCSGTTVQVTDASTGSATAWSYTVTGPAMITSTLQNPVLNLTAAGDYSVTLIATNGSGDSAPVTETVSVKSLPPVTASGPTGSVCAGDMVTLAGGGASTYSWTNGVINNTAFAINTSAIYTVTGTDAFGCTNSATFPVGVNPLPVLTVGGSTAICIGAVATVSVSGADTYTWVGFGNADTFTDSPTANITYTASGTNATTGCSNTVNAPVIVNALPTIVPNSGSVCLGDVFTFNPGGAASYAYSSGSNTVSPTSNDSYTVTGTDAHGCVSTAVIDVTVNPLPVVSVSGGTLCEGSTFVLAPTGAVNYSYAPSLTASVSPVTTTSYSITGVDANGCRSQVAAVAEITVSPAPVFSVNTGTICAGSSFTLVPSSASTLTFTFANGSNTVTPTITTNYTVTGQDMLGCQANVVSQVTVIALPVVSVNSGSICAGDVFTMTPSGAYSYIFSNGSNTVSPTSNTSYSVTGSTIEGCVSASYAVSNVTVNAVPVISVNNGSICVGDAFTIAGSGASTYIYQGGSANVSPNATTSYTVIGISAQGCLSSNTATSTVNVWSLPVVAINSPSAICSGQTATLNVSGASTYTWVATSSTATSYIVNPTANTTYTVIGTDGNGCTNVAMQLLVVNALPVITVNSGTICPGASFTMTPSGAVSYVFQGGSAVVSPASTTSYSVTGTDANGCTSTMGAISTVNVRNTLTITVTGNTAICAGQTANLTANGATTYFWNTNATTNTVAVTPSSSTNYVVTGTSAGCSQAYTVAVTVNALPNVMVSTGTPTICAGESATLTSTGAVNYSWSNSSSTGSSIVINPTITTSYTVTGTDANSCSNIATVVQNVSDCTGLSKIENTSVNVSIFPNPSNGEFTITLSQETSVKILNGVGQVIYVNTLQNGDNTVLLSNQPNGIYFVQLTQGNQTKTMKVVKN